MNDVIEAMAREVFHTFTPEHVEPWEGFEQQEEYRAAVRAALATAANAGFILIHVHASDEMQLAGEKVLILGEHGNEHLSIDEVCRVWDAMIAARPTDPSKDPGS